MRHKSVDSGLDSAICLMASVTAGIGEKYPYIQWIYSHALNILSRKEVDYIDIQLFSFFSTYSQTPK